MIRIIEDETGKILTLSKSKKSIIPPCTDYIEILHKEFGKIHARIISITHDPKSNLILIRVSFEDCINVR